MFQVNYLNKISPKGTALWTENYRQSQTVEEADVLVVRSAALHDMAFSDNLLARSGFPARLHSARISIR